jgi:hypothetical protein
MNGELTPFMVGAQCWPPIQAARNDRTSCLLELLEFHAKYQYNTQLIECSENE